MLYFLLFTAYDICGNNAITDFLMRSIFNHFFKKTDVDSPSGLYVGLFSTVDTEDRMNSTEITGNGYARQSITFSAPSTIPSGARWLRNIYNTNTLTFTASGGNWGAINLIGVFDASTGGNCLALYDPKLGYGSNITINDGQTWTIAPSDIILSLAM